MFVSLTRPFTRPAVARVRTLALAAILTLACGEGGTDATPPAQPSGTILAFHPIGDLYQLDPATSTTRQISHAGTPISWFGAALGPGGRVVTGKYNSSTEAVRMVDLDTGRWTVLLPMEGDAFTTTTKLSPSGTRLAFSGMGWQGTEHALLTLDLTTRQITVQWEGAYDETFGMARMRWLPDESGVVAVAEYGQTNQIAHIDFTTHAVTYLTEPFPNNAWASLDVSPDGKTVAYAGDGEAGVIRFITLDGTPAPGYPVSIAGILPSFSPDGRFLAYSPLNPSGIAGSDGIWLHRFADGAEWRLLPVESEVVWVFDWE